MSIWLHIGSNSKIGVDIQEDLQTLRVTTMQIYQNLRVVKDRYMCYTTIGRFSAKLAVIVFIIVCIRFFLLLDAT